MAIIGLFWFLVPPASPPRYFQSQQVVVSSYQAFLLKGLVIAWTGPALPTVTDLPAAVLVVGVEFPLRTQGIWAVELHAAFKRQSHR